MSNKITLREWSILMVALEEKIDNKKKLGHDTKEYEALRKKINKWEITY